MADQKPPRLADDEATVLRTLLDYQRSSFARKIDGVADGAASRSPVASGTTLLWLANHMADAERIWVLHRFAGGPAPQPEDHLPTVAGALSRYRETCAAVDDVLDRHALDEVCPSFDQQGAVSLRWILAHLLEETSRHAGHADILRELVDGQTGR